MNHIETLKSLKHTEDCKKYPSMNPDYIPVFKYTDKTANGLTRCIVDYINLTGGQAERISNTGRYVDNKIIVKDVLGNTRTIGSGKYIKGTGTNGTADISSTIRININGKTVGVSAKWEVKMKDKQSYDQIQYQQQVENAGGHYFITHDFDEFIFYYESLLDYYSK